MPGQRKGEGASKDGEWASCATRCVLCGALLAVAAAAAAAAARGPSEAGRGTRPIDRFAAAGLSAAAFRERYLGVAPVVIEAPQQRPAGISVPQLTEMCPQMMVDVLEPGGLGWANLRPVGTWQIRTLAKAWAAGNRSLHGWEGDLACECPALLERLAVRVPPYFARDVIWDQVVTRWPSLLIGHPGPSSGMHIDKYGLPLWLFLSSGSKLVRVIVSEDVQSHLGHLWDEYGFARSYDTMLKHDFFSDTLAFDLISRGVTVFEAVLKPGDLLYIPQMAAHGAKNLGREPAIAVTANFLDRAHAQILWRNLNRTGCSGLDVGRRCDEESGNTIKIIAEQAEPAEEVATDTWQRFADLRAAGSHSPWCFGKQVHCKARQADLGPITNECEALEKGSLGGVGGRALQSLLEASPKTALELSRSPHLRSAGLASHVGASLLRDDFPKHLEDAERLFALGASEGIARSQKMLGVLGLVRERLLKEPDARIRIQLPRARFGGLT